jgi:hypothetical protein
VKTEENALLSGLAESSYGWREIDMHEENKQILHEYLFLLSGYK